MNSININKKNLYLNKLFKIYKMIRIMHIRKMKDSRNQLINLFKIKIKEMPTIKLNLRHLMISYRLRSKK